jgi:hypothetical protein
VLTGFVGIAFHTPHNADAPSKISDHQERKTTVRALDNDSTIIGIY